MPSLSKHFLCRARRHIAGPVVRDGRTGSAGPRSRTPRRCWSWRRSCGWLFLGRARDRGGRLAAKAGLIDLRREAAHDPQQVAPRRGLGAEFQRAGEVGDGVVEPPGEPPQRAAVEERRRQLRPLAVRAGRRELLRDGVHEVLGAFDCNRCTSPRSRRGDSESPRCTDAWTPSRHSVVVCSSVARGGGTLTCPMGRASSLASSRPRVSAQYRGASSRYRSRGQYGMTRMTSAR